MLRFRSPLFYLNVISLLLFSSFDSYAQQIWTAVSVEKKIKDKWELGVQIQNRKSQEPREISSLFTEARVGYQLLKKIEVAGSYRYRFITSNLKNRYAIEMNFLPLSTEMNFALKGRIIFHRDFGNDIHTDRLRFLAETRYKFGKTKPTFSVEMFNRPNDNFGISRIRSTLGVVTQVTRNFELTVFYRRDEDFDNDENYEDTDYIIGVMVGIEIKPPRGKKKPDKPIDQ